MASTRVALGRLEAALGETECAATHLDEALALARETKKPETILGATVELARLPGGDTNAALAAFVEREERVGHAAKMEARFRLLGADEGQDPSRRGAPAVSTRSRPLPRGLPRLHDRERPAPPRHRRCVGGARERLTAKLAHHDAHH